MTTVHMLLSSHCCDSYKALAMINKTVCMHNLLSQEPATVADVCDGDSELGSKRKPWPNIESIWVDWTSKVLWETGKKGYRFTLQTEFSVF